jgi:hypothetical protein
LSIFRPQQYFASLLASVSTFSSTFLASSPFFSLHLNEIYNFYENIFDNKYSFFLLLDPPNFPPRPPAPFVTAPTAGVAGAVA